MISVKRELEFNLKREFRSFRPLHGGSIATAFTAETTRGEKYFVKVYEENGEYVKSEVNGLKEIEKTGTVKTPSIIFNTGNLLVLQYIEEGRSSKDFWERFGNEFAALHRFTYESPGYFENNYIGLTPQINSFKDNWPEFFMENRLLYQIKLAEKSGRNGYQIVNEYLRSEKRIRETISNYNHTNSLLHGDLWSGNYLCAEGGVPVLIDPAVYYGDREADLAMTKLFGGFDPYFYFSYNESFRTEDGWQEREPVYKLYHVLNHYNLFGESYLSQAVAIMRKYRA